MTLARSVLFALWLAVPAGAARAQADDGGEAPPPEPDPGSIHAFDADAGPPSTGPLVTRLTLAQAVQRALEHNPSSALAHDEVVRAEALVREARSAWFPTVTGNGYLLHYDGPRVYNGVEILPQNQANGNITFTVPLFAAKQWETQWAAQDNVASVKYSEADSKRVIAVAVARAYLTIIAQGRIIEASRLAVEADAAHRDFAQQRYSGGVGNRVDLVRAQQELAADQAKVEQAVSGLANAREALGVLVATEGAVDAADDGQLAPPPPAQQALDDSLALRNDVQALEVRARAADRIVRAHWTDFTPLVEIVAFPFLQTPAISTTPNEGWQAELLLTWPIYDGGLRYAQQEEREVLAHEAHLNIEQAGRQVHSDVRAAFSSMEHADTALLSARSAAKLAHEGLDLANLAYRAGANTNLEVIDAERTSLDADTNAAIAEDASRQARLDLLAASGRFPY